MSADVGQSSGRMIVLPESSGMLAKSDCCHRDIRLE